MMTRLRLADDLDISRIVYGMWRVCDDADTSPARVQRKIETALACGITTIDQADIYGGYTAESVLGAALRAAPQLRDRVEIVTKCGIVAPVGRHAAARIKHYDTTAAHIAESVHASLRAMATDRIDLLLIHRPDPMIDPEETGRALDDLVASGKVRSVGVSNFRPWDFTLLQSAMRQPLVTNQIEISLTCTGCFTNGDLAFLQERRLPVMAWSPLGGGNLVAAAPERLRTLLARLAADHDVDVSAIAIAWLLRHPARLVPILGTNDPARIEKACAALRVDLDRQAWFELYTAALGHDVP